MFYYWQSSPDFLHLSRIRSLVHLRNQLQHQNSPQRASVGPQSREAMKLEHNQTVTLF